MMCLEVKLVPSFVLGTSLLTFAVQNTFIMKSSNIKSFSVYGLFGTSDVHIPFDENIKILIGENGLGKTQVLDILYYTLTRNFIRLNAYVFDTINIDFEKESIQIKKQDLENVVNTADINPFLKSIIDLIGIKEVVKLRNEIAHGQITRRDFRQHYLYDKINSKYSIDEVYDLILLNIDNIKKLFDFDKIIDNKKMNAVLGETEVLYLPTFRQLKEYFKWYNLEHYTSIQFEKSQIIEFGMDDVENRFGDIEKTINKLLKEGLAQFTTDILSVVIDDTAPTRTILDKINENDIDIILSRVGNLLPLAQKKAIRDIVAKKQLKNPLSLYLLQKLIDIYENQKELDNSVKLFRDVCNKYLIDKQVFYDESAIKIYIKSDITHSELALNKLSSGEKQIISIFSKIYLSEPTKRFIILFDEPELSLSMIWQKQLLPDIINSKKCNFLLAVTHSPFIFDNELDKYAVGLNEYIKPLKPAIV